MCGDYQLIFSGFSLLIGSPPHVRGLLSSPWPWNSRGRITPACAGTTGTTSLLAQIAEDHPRMCGDYWITVMG